MGIIFFSIESDNLNFSDVSRDVSISSANEVEDQWGDGVSKIYVHTCILYFQFCRLPSNFVLCSLYTYYVYMVVHATKKWFAAH